MGLTLTVSSEYLISEYMKVVLCPDPPETRKEGLVF